MTAPIVAGQGRAGHSGSTVASNGIVKGGMRLRPLCQCWAWRCPCMYAAPGC